MKNSSNTMSLPTIIPASIDTGVLDDLIRVGFCYVPLPDVSFLAKLKTCLAVAREFFLRSSEEKAKWQAIESFKSNQPHQGYAARTNTKSMYAMEQLFFEPDSPLALFSSYYSLVKEINDYFLNDITLPIIQAIFKRLNFSDIDFLDATRDAYRAMVFQYYRH